MSDFIERLTVKNYGCVKDVSVELTPLHAFIGPNDSGKSTLLRAMRTLVQLAGDTFRGALDNLQPFEPGFPPLSKSTLGLNWRDVSYVIEVGHRTQFAEQVKVVGRQATHFQRNWFSNNLHDGSLMSVSQGDAVRFS